MKGTAPQWLISYAVLAAAFFIGFFNRFAPATFSDPIGESFSLSAAALGGLAAAHFWTYTMMQVPAGLIVDRFGIKWPATIGATLTGIGALTLGTAPSYLVALCGPIAVGVGMSVVFVTMMKNNTLWFEGERFGRITGVTMLIAALGSVASEGPARSLLAMLDWRAIFIGVGGATLIVAGLIAFVWTSPPSTTESTEPTQLNRSGIWKEAFSNPQIWLIMLAIAGTNGTYYAFAGLWGTRLLETGFNLGNEFASWVITLSLVPYGLGSLLVGQLSDRMGTRRWFIIGAASLNLASWVVLAVGPWSAPAVGIVSLFFLGVSSSQVVVSFAAVRESVQDKIAGVSIALVNMGVFLTTGITQFFYGTLLQWVSPDEPSALSFRVGLVLPVAIAMAGLVAALLVTESFKRSTFKR